MFELFKLENLKVFWVIGFSFTLTPYLFAHLFTAS